MIKENINYEFDAGTLIYYGLMDETFKDKIPNKSKLKKDSNIITKYIKKIIPKVKKITNEYKNLSYLLKQLCLSYNKNMINELFLTFYDVEFLDSTNLNKNIILTKKIFIFKKLLETQGEDIKDEDILDFDKYFLILDKYISDSLENKESTIYYILKFYNNFEVLIKDFLILRNKIIEIIDASIDENINNLIDKYSKNLTSDYISNLIKNNFKIEMSIEEVKISILNPLHLEIQSVDNTNIDVTVGILFDSAFKLMSNFSFESRVFEIFKALGDETRFEMFKLSNEKEIYIQEMAKQFKVKASTISHHLNILTSQNLLKVEINKEDKQKILYRSNKEELIKLRDYLNTLIGE